MQTLQAPATTPLASPGGARRRQAIASLLGERQFELIDWRRLMRDGALVRLHIAGTSMFWVQLSYEDLGIHVEDPQVRQQLTEWMTLGKKRLLPKAYMRSLGQIEGSARYALKERSFRTELGAFVPSSAYVGWRTTTESLREHYLALRDDIIANHASLTRQVLSHYEGIARDTYQRLRERQPDVVSESEEQFILTYTQRIAAHIPSPDRIREKFEFKYVLVDGLSQVGPTRAAEQVAEAPVSVETIEEARTEVRAAERARSRIERDLRSHARERVNAALDDFLTSVVGQLRALTYEVACDVLTTLQRRSGESISPRSILQLNHLLTQVRTLNFYEDADIDRMMLQIEQITQQNPAQRQASVADIARTLRAIATVTRSTLLDLGEEPRSAREVGIPDFPTDSSVRTARAEVGLTLDQTQLTALMQTRSEVRAERAETNRTGMESLWAWLSQEPTRAARPV